MPPASLNSSSKNPRSRRKKQAQATRVVSDAGFEDKENRFQNSGSAFSSPAHDSDDFANEKKSSVGLSFNSALHSEFRQCLHDTPVETDLHDFADYIAQASLSNCLPTAFLHNYLDDPVPFLISIARKLIKEATALQQQQEQPKTRRRLFGCLFVACHTLRAVGPLLDDESSNKRMHQLETVLRLLYHVVHLSAEAKKRGHSDWRLQLIVISAFETMQHRLCHYACSGDLHGVSVSLHLVEDFAMPILSSQQWPESRTMSLRQLSSIALKTAQATATAASLLFQKSNQPQSWSTISLSSYGEFCTAVVRQLQQNAENPLQAILKMFRHFWLPWLEVLGDSKDQECLKDLSSHSKVAHRLLWDLASLLKKSKCYGRNDIDRWCLELRMQAVLMLLPQTDDRIAGDEVSMESACSYAWKAATVFAQSQSALTLPASQGPLADYHRKIGVAMDPIVSRLEELPVSYVEYATYRQLHTGARPPVSCDPKENEYSLRKAVLAIALLGVQLRQNLESNLTCGGEVLISYQEEIQAFNENVISRAPTLESVECSRYFKLLSMISLHRTVFLATKHQAWIGNERSLHLAGVWLLKCLGPFAFAFLHKGGDGLDIHQAYDIAVECYIRPLSLYEKLTAHYVAQKEASASSLYSTICLESIQELHRALNAAIIDPPINCLEKCAKSLSILSRQRVELSREQESVLPQLVSLQMYQALVDRQQQKGEGDYQLSVRLNQLATIYQSLGKSKEACLVLCIILVLETTSFSAMSKCGTEELDFVGFLSRRSKLVLPPREDLEHDKPIIKATIRRIAALFCEYGLECSLTGNAEVKRRVTLSSALDMLIQSDATNDCICSLTNEFVGAAHNFCGFVSATFHPHVTFFSGQATCSNLYMLVELLVHLGSSISRMFMGPTTNKMAKRMLVDYQTIFSFAEEGIAASFLGCGVISSLLVSLLHLVASTSLLPVRSFYEDTAQGTKFGDLEDSQIFSIKEFSSRGRSVVESVAISEVPEEWMGVARAIRLSVCQYSMYLEGTASAITMDFLNMCKGTVDKELQQKSRLRISQEWIKWTLMNLQSRACYTGDTAKSTIIAFWALSLVNDDDDEGERSWFASVANSSFVESQSADVTSMLVTDATVQSAHSLSGRNSFTSIAAHELFLSVSNLRRFHNGRYNDSGLGLVKREIEQVSSNATGDVLVLSQWLLSSVEINQAMSAICSGDLTVALGNIQSCLSLCQSVMARSKNSADATQDTPLWVHLAVTTLFIQARQRYVKCLLLKSRLYARLGDYRKALTYVVSLPGVFGFEAVASRSRDKVSVLRHSISSFVSTKSSMIRRYARLRLQLDCLLSPSDLVIKEFSSISPQDLIAHWPENGIELGLTQDLITAGDILYGEAITSKLNSGFLEYYGEASQRELRVRSTLADPARLPNCIKDESSSPSGSKFKLLRARCLLHAADDAAKSSVLEAISLCQEIIDDSFCSSVDAAWAYFYLGNIEMNDARESGSLRRLWTESRIENRSKSLNGSSIERARQHFFEAAVLVSGSGSDVFYRTILRNLALATGPEMNEISGEAAGMLVLSSIGMSTRRLLAHSLFEKPGTNEFHDAFMCFDHCLDGTTKRDECLRQFFLQFAKVVPSSWCFMAPAICVSGELLITTVGKSTEHDGVSFKTRCIFPDESQETGAYDAILKPLDDILSRSQQQLNGMDPDTVSTHFSKDEAKRNWWSARNNLDQDLAAHIASVERRYFSTIHLRSNSLDPIFEVAGHSENLPCGNLASRFEAACDLSENNESHSENNKEELRMLTVPKLKDKLRDSGFSNAQMRKLRKHEIIEKLIELDEAKRQKEDAANCDERSQSCLFLLLDENLHRFPFEGMQALEGKSVCRIPSLPFVYSTLLECISSRNQQPVVDPSNASYVLDPENNLQATQKRLLPVLQGISSSNGWGWNGVIGETPSQSFFRRALEKENGLLIYFGHGGAQTCFSRRQVDQMISAKDNSEVRTCKASVILMGCSSGRLVSVNRKDSETLEQLPLYFEPEGIALSYLCAGSPCVVGNLWDVTDHDIDRFSIELFQKFFSHDDLQGTKTLASCVASARSACKLKYIVGCAPVCYGVPLHLY